jgi:phosphatidylserine/phosphatidylglycerophosphate/cardiolipin synthase-like enzyme
MQAEAWLGETISDQIARHHRRRLRRIGWEHALVARGFGWARGDPPPRAGNKIEILIDGAAALPAIAREIENARSHVHLTGWFVSPSFALVPGERPVVVRHLLSEAAERVKVRVLLWAGAPLPLFRPSRRDVREVRDELTTHTRVEVGLDPKERPLHCHHEKTIVIDDRVAFVGGIDLTDEAGARYDTSEHPPRAAIGWHDAAARIEGPAVRDVADHFRVRWHEIMGERLPAPEEAESAGDVELQVVRTVPEKVYGALPRGDFRILESYAGAFRAAERFIYLENQFLWSPEIARILRDKLIHPPSTDFRIVLVLPSNPKSGDDDTRGVLAELLDADDGNGRILPCALYARAGPRADSIYVHAKIGVVDDRWLTIGSANLNEHSLFNDTEMNVVAHDPKLARQTRLRLWSEHLEQDAPEDDPVRVIDELWRPISEEQLDRRLNARALTHRLVRLPHVSKRTRRMLGPIDSLFVDG